MRRLLTYGVLGVAWVLVAVIAATQVYLQLHAVGQDPPWIPVFRFQVVIWLPWAFYTVRIFRLEATLRQRPWLQHVRGHVLFFALTIIVTLVLATSDSFIDGPLPPGAVLAEKAQTVLINFLPQYAAVYVAIFGLSYAYHSHHEAKARAIRASQLETQLVEAQLQTLKRQIQPHFLFNTLNTIAVLVRRQDHRSADRTIRRLGDLLRYSLETHHDQTVPLHKEMEALRTYLDIETLRFDDRLTVQLQIDPATRDALVPAFILQPLVENALRHGIARTIESGTLTVQSTQEDAALVLRVTDTGPGFGEDVHPGIGLTTTRERLEQLYGDRQSFVIQPAADGCGAQVEIRLPYEPSSESHPALSVPIA